MIRTSMVLLTIVGLCIPTVPAFAQTPPAAAHAHKAKPAKRNKASVPTAAPAAGGINAPSTDFSTIERADEEPRGADGPSIHPAMGAGGMGVGGAF